MTAEAVWSALAEVEDPEIPVISLVDLGVDASGLAFPGERPAKWRRKKVF